MATPARAQHVLAVSCAARTCGLTRARRRGWRGLGPCPALQLCTRIVSDPDRSDRIMPLKREAFQRRQALLDAQASAAAQGGRQAAQ